MPNVQGGKRRPRWSRYAGMGVEFASALVAFCLLGWWIDRHWQIQGHWGLFTCAMIGLVGGLYNFIRQALAAAREAEDVKAGKSNEGRS